MKRILFLSILLCLVFSSAFPAIIMLDDCEDTTYDTATVDGSDAVTLSTSTDKTEGAGSLQVDYTYVDENQWVKQTAITKTFASTIDISDMEIIKYDANVAAASAPFMLLVLLEDESGLRARFENWTFFTESTDGWETKHHVFSGLHKSKWVTGGKAINLKKIQKIEYLITNEYAASGIGSLSFKIDNVRFETERGLLNEVVIEDFESYADDSALASAWPQTFSNPTTFTLETTDIYDGAKAGRLYGNVTGYYSNHAREFTLPSVTDYSDLAYVKIAVKGPVAMEPNAPIAHIWFKDSNGWLAIGYIWNWADDGEWAEIYMPFVNDGVCGFQDSSWTPEWDWAANASCWREDRWVDGGGWDEDTQFDKISGLLLSFETSVDGDIGQQNILFDEITFGYATTDPGTSVADWNMY